MKTCSKCKKSLSIAENFSKNSRRKDGLQVYCKTCMKAANAKHYSEYKSTQMAINKETKDLHRSRIIEIKKANPCPCGESCVACLDFHHLDNKEASVSRMLGNSHCWERIVRELNKCCVICANCHRKFHAGVALKFEMIALQIST